MTTVVLLDTGPLGLATHPRGGEDARHCQNWLREILAAGLRVVVPAISDYELRRELIRAGKAVGERRLDELVDTLGYLSLDRETLREAARLWAVARAQGHPTAPNLALDGDCILAAQAKTAPLQLEFTREERLGGIEVIIATTNAKHLGRYADARLWSSISANL